jgi:hypothetical protein
MRKIIQLTLISGLMMLWGFSTVVYAQINTFPYTETFDGFTTSSPNGDCNNDGNVSLSDGWVNVSGDDIDWDVRTGCTGSGGCSVGPNGDVTGGGNYLYTEASNCYYKTGSVISPEFDFSSITSPTLSFYYNFSADGNPQNMGRMTVFYSIDNKSTWDSIWWDGNTESVGWVEEIIDLTSLAKTSLAGESSVYFKWQGLTGPAYQSDMAFDQVKVYNDGNPTTTWTGTTNNDWATAGNWDNGVPDATMDVIIPTGLTNYPTVGAAASCINLTLKSDASGDASLIGQGNIAASGTITVERYVSKYTSASSGWHFLSSPINGFTIAGSDFVPGSGTYDLYRWGESTVVAERWLNYKAANFSHATFETGLGYLISYDSDGTKNFTGAFNTGSIAKSVSYTAGAGEGWNLIGNPYPSAIDADLITFSATVNHGVYVVNPSDGSYWAHNGAYGDAALAGGEIPINQGFFVEATAAGTVTMETSDQIHSTHDFNKKEQELPEESLVVTLKGQSSENSTYFQFRDDATMEFDGQADAYKLFGWATIAQVYSELDDTKYSINCLGYSNETVSIPLGIHLTANEELDLAFSGMETFPNSVRIDLEDTQTGITLNIKENPVYSFSGDINDEANRFLLHFNGVTAVEDIKAASTPLVYSVDQNIYISTTENIDADIFIYNVNGQLISQDKLRGEQMKKINFTASTGIYLVSVQSAGTVWNQKVYIK